MAKISTNVPANPELYLTQDDGSLEKFSVGDKVTILMHNHNMRTGVISKFSLITSAYVPLTELPFNLILSLFHCQL